MANFLPAYNKLLQAEGGFVNNPNDAGFRTFAGISETNWPNEPIWAKINERIAAGVAPEIGDPELMPLVESFYRRNFWDKMLGDRIDNQRVAEAIFDTAVNFSLVRAVTFTQMSLRIIFFNKVEVDGKVGIHTLQALNRMDAENVEQFIALLISKRHHHRWERITKDPTDVEFMVGWLNRDNKL